MANYRRRFVIVISAAVIFSLFLIWLVFQPHALDLIGQKRTVFVVLACLCVVPILFFHRIAKLQPGSSIGLLLIAGFLVLTSLDGIAFFAFDLDNVWTDGIRYISQLLVFGAVVLFIRQAVRKSREKERETSRTDH